MFSAYIYSVEKKYLTKSLARIYFCADIPKLEGIMIHP